METDRSNFFYLISRVALLIAILLDKLYHYGIRGVSHKLFSNFLHNRMQCTKI